MKKAMVILSGGQDSTTCLFWALENYDHVEAITFDYGQKHIIEIAAAKTIAEMANVLHYTVKVPNILRSRSPLVDENQTLETYDNYEEMDKVIGDRVELTFVPMRNAFFITIAANYALHNDIYTLVTGVCQQDNANYPDCRESFIQSQEKTINEALGIDNFKIVTPLINMTKAESVELVNGLAMFGENKCMDALAYSHTCYSGVYPPCGKCHSCVLRAYGFEQAGVDDPLIVRAAEEQMNQ
jgi:7-cyano-7-deazaguanine synthase